MAYNQQVLTTLQNIEFLRSFDEDTQTRIIDALRSVYQADVADASAFRNAFTAHQDTWKKILGADVPITDSDDFLLSTGEGDDNQKTANSFIGLKNAAAFARVSLGIEKMDLTELNRLANAGKEDFVALQNLTDEGFKKIQERANELLFNGLEKKLDSLNITPDADEYKNLIKASLFNTLDDLKVNIGTSFPIDWIKTPEQFEQVRFLFRQKALDTVTSHISFSTERDFIVGILKATKAEEIPDPINTDKWLQQDDITLLQIAARPALFNIIEKELTQLKQDNGDPSKQIQHLLSAVLPSTDLKKLAAVGINNTDFLEQKDVQKLAQLVRKKTFELYLEKQSHFGAVGHDELVKAFGKATSEEQSKIMENIAASFRPGSKATVLSILKGTGLATQKEVVEEHQKHVLLKKLHNAALAGRLANPEIPPIEKVTPEVITRLNGIVDTAAAAWATADDDEDQADPNLNTYNTFATDINQAIGGARVLPIDGEIPADIKNQFDFNALLSDPGSTNYELYSSFLSILKIDDIVLEDRRSILKIFNESNTYNEFVHKLPDRTKQKFAPDWQQNFTPGDFSRIKAKQIESKNDIKDKIRDAKELISNMDKDFNALAMIDSDTNVTFYRILNTNFENLFNPAFMAKGRENAKKVIEPFKELAGNCSVIIGKLEEQESVLKVLLDVTAKQPFIEERLKKVQRDLSKYRKVQESLLGTGGVRKGILQMIDETVKGGVAIKGYYSDNTHCIVNVKFRNKSSKDNSQDDKDEDATAKADNKNTSVSFGGSVSPTFEVSKIPPDKLRVFNVSHNNNYDGEFIEELAPSNPNLITVKARSSTPSIRLEVTKFPKADGGDPGTIAKINFAMVMASQMLSSLDGPPSKNNPLIIRGGNPDERNYLWTALMILGREKHMRFGAEAIHPTAPFKSEKGMIGRFASGSLYSTVFSEHEAVYKRHVDPFQSLCERKFGLAPSIKILEADLSQLHTKNTIKDQLEKAKNEVGIGGGDNEDQNTIGRP